MTQSPLKWIGGKHASAQRIVSAFPSPDAYDIYVEPCGGAAHVFMCKPPYGHKEIYNDLDNNLFTFWTEMKTNAKALHDHLQSLPFARALYYEYYRSLFDGTQLSSTERAARWFYALRGTGTGHLRRSPVGWCGGLKTGAHAYRSALATFLEVQERFKYVAIDNRDALATIRRYDSSRTLFYVDPPYLGAEHYYEASKNGFPHQGLAQLLQTVKGYVALSYYPHPNIDEWYGPTWRRETWQQHKSSQIQNPGEQEIATEMLLCNYPAPAQSLWNDNDVNIDQNMDGDVA
jgi:DNA adenine methylase